MKEFRTQVMYRMPKDQVVPKPEEKVVPVISNGIYELTYKEFGAVTLTPGNKYSLSIDFEQKTFKVVGHAKRKRKDDK